MNFSKDVDVLYSSERKVKTNRKNWARETIESPSVRLYDSNELVVRIDAP